MPVSRHPARASRVGPVARRRTIHSIWSESSAGPFTTTFVVASNLSVGSGVIVIFSCWAHLTASARFRAGPQGPVSGRLSKTASWRSGPAVVVSRRLSATGFRFSAILFPPRSSALLTVGLPATNGMTGPRRGYRVPHARATTGLGALSTPGTVVLIRAGGDHRPAPAASQRRCPYTPPPTSHLARARITRHQRGFKQFARPGFPSPVAARMERAAASAFPRASHPTDQEPGNARRGGDRPSSTDLELHAQLTSVDLQSSSSLNTCDLASHSPTR